jgi:hypothetical protein
MASVLHKNGTIDELEPIAVPTDEIVTRINQSIEQINKRISRDDIIGFKIATCHKLEIEVLVQTRKISTSIFKERNVNCEQVDIENNDPWSVVISCNDHEEEYSRKLYLRGSMKESICSKCKGQGKVACYKCVGQGLILCPKCKGVNSSVETSIGNREGVATRAIVGTVLAGPIGLVLGGATAKRRTVTSSKICPKCLGKGALVCTQCNGQSVESCTECDGTGHVFTGLCLTIQNKYLSRDHLINPFGSLSEKSLQFDSHFVMKLAGDDLLEEIIGHIPASQISIIKPILSGLINIDDGKIKSLKVKISSLPIINVAYNWNGKLTAVLLLGKNLVVNKVSSRSKGRAIALLLSLVLGLFGAHRFYVKRWKTGTLMLLLSLTLYGLLITSVWTIIDIISILLGRFKEKDGTRLSSWK